jgi:hypothetical protein
MKKTIKPAQTEKPSRFGKGHGTDALGPSDTSDSGSDVRGGPGLSQDDVAVGLDRGTTSDPDREPRAGAGPDVGDAGLDSDTDASGTGEHATAGRDSPWKEAADISPDAIHDLPDTELDAEDGQDREAASPRSSTRRARHPKH